MSIDQLRDSITGRVITPSDDGYEDARKVYNAMIDKRPAVIVRVAGVDDVVRTIAYARDGGLDLSVRTAGAHSGPGYGTNDGGVVLDLSDLRRVTIDPKARTAHVQGGATLGDLNDAGYEHGLATTGGIVASTGVAGLTLGGGSGYLNRAFGLTIDNLLSAEVVTADGRVLTASDKENDDLFWALRGGGGNFGVVTSLELRMHPVKDIIAGLFFYELEHAAEVLEFYDRYITDAPEPLGMFPAFLVAPPLPFIQEAYHGTHLVGVVSSWAGDPDEAEKVLGPIRDIAPRVGEMIGPMPYPTLNSSFDALVPPGMRQYWKGIYGKDLDAGAVAAHLEYGPKIPTMNSAMHIYSINGAVNRVPADATAFAHRDAKYSTVIVAIWDDPADDQKNIAWARDYAAALAPHSMESGYVNFAFTDDASKVTANYGGNLERLRAIKRTYDPDNLFHLNHNIAP